jgi:hypothetical protein
MEFILDFQGFKNEQNKFVVKELAIISTDGNLYELQLFQPPCHFNELPDSVKKQVIWLEKQFHGLYWGSGHKHYNELEDVFRGVNLEGKVYVKGTEKEAFVKELLKNFPVTVINIEDLGCPGLNILKKQMQKAPLKPCSFNHNSKNCAYLNCHALLQWWKFEKFAYARLEMVDLSIKECFSKGFLNIPQDLVRFLPKHFILNKNEDIEYIFDKLPKHLQTDEDILANMRCTDHRFWNGSTTEFDGPMQKRKDCFFCKYKAGKVQ